MKTRMSQKHCNTIKSNNCSTFVQNIKQSKIKKRNTLSVNYADNIHI